MLAVGLTVTLFAFWLVLGYAVCAWLNAERDRLPNLLLAPAVGVAVTVIPLFVLNRLGLPVGRFGPQLAVVLLVGAGFLLWRLRPGWPPLSYLPFVAVLGLSLALTGSPLFQFGFDWVSYCNDDMANYCLGARRLYDHGLYDIPDGQTLLTGRDYSQFYWFLHVPSMSRVGCELTLAWVRSIARTHEHAIFMPVILAFHLVLISAAGALVMQSAKEKEHRRAALATCLLLALSAMTTLGTVYQVIAQVVGLALLAATAAVVLRPFTGVPRAEIARHGVLVGLLGVGVMILYPEVLPFLALSFLLYLGIDWARRREAPRALLTIAGVGAALALVVLNLHLLTVFRYVTGQTAGGTVGDDPANSLMPYFLIPRGLANFWGLQSIVQLAREPWMSLGIGWGAVLMIAGVVASFWMAWRGNRAAAFAVVMLVLGLFLFQRRTGFGLFKLAMFVQPFLLASIVAACFALIKKPRLRYLPLVAIAAMGLGVQASYIRDSKGYGATFSLIPNATPSRLVDEFVQVVERHKGRPLVADPYNIVLGKFQALHAQGQPLVFPSDAFFKSVMGYNAERTTARDAVEAAEQLTLAMQAHWKEAAFDLHDPAHPGRVNHFLVIQSDAVAPVDGTILVGSTGDQGIFNRRKYPEGSSSGNFVAKPLSEVSNHLIFISSEFGRPFYAPNTPYFSLFQLENEPRFFPGGTMSGVGRHLLFEVVNPTETVRLAINLTSSYRQDGQSKLPPAAAIGATREPFPLTGRGSAKVFSPPLKPQTIGGRHYVALDLGEEGRRFAYPRRGLMTAYGRDVAIDRRVLVAFARDVSVVSEDEYRKLSPPSALYRFPADLTHPDLEYAGLYEDGWTSEAVSFNLSQKPGQGTLVVKGEVPGTTNAAFQTEMTVLLDGQEVAKRVLPLGQFAVQVPAPPSNDAGSRRVELRFSALQPLPLDGRPIAARLTTVGFDTGTIPVARGN